MLGPACQVRAAEAIGHRHNASQMRRDLWFAHCQQLVAQEQLKLETVKATTTGAACPVQAQELQAQLAEATSAGKSL